MLDANDDGFNAPLSVGCLRDFRDYGIPCSSHETYAPRYVAEFGALHFAICSYATIAYLAQAKFSSMSVPGDFRCRAYGTILRVSKNGRSER